MSTLQCSACPKVSIMEYLPLGSQMIFWIGLTASSSSSRKPHMVCDFDFETSSTQISIHGKPKRRASCTRWFTQAPMAQLWQPLYARCPNTFLEPHTTLRGPECAACLMSVPWSVPSVSFLHTCLHILYSFVSFWNQQCTAH